MNRERCLVCTTSNIIAVYLESSLRKSMLLLTNCSAFVLCYNISVSSTKLYRRSALSSMAARISQRALNTKSMSFDISASSGTHNVEPRLGRLSCSGRKDIQTPNHFALSSRGAIPHLSQDTVRDNSEVKGVYTAIEDCERLHLFAASSKSW